MNERSLNIKPTSRAVVEIRGSTLMALSVSLASLALLADSPAFIIGAMVVAWLMGPVLGVSAAVIMG